MASCVEKVNSVNERVREASRLDFSKQASMQAGDAKEYYSQALHNEWQATPK